MRRPCRSRQSNGTSSSLVGTMARKVDTSIGGHHTTSGIVSFATTIGDHAVPSQSQMCSMGQQRQTDSPSGGDNTDSYINRLLTSQCLPIFCNHRHRISYSLNSSSQSQLQHELPQPARRHRSRPVATLGHFHLRRTP